MTTFTSILYHIVFGSKDYTAFLTRSNQDIVFRYIAGILINKKCHPHRVGGYKNHIHIVFDLHPAVSLSSLVRDIKRSTSEMMKNDKKNFHLFPGWQVGYGAFTYSAEALTNLVNYVSNQDIHHGRLSFKEELIRFLQEQGIQYDEKYILI